MLALDPPLGDGSRAHAGGVVANGRLGPDATARRAARPRAGVTVALTDGRSRGRGEGDQERGGYDLGNSSRLAWSRVIVELSVRLHPLPPAPRRSRSPVRRRPVAAAACCSPCTLSSNAWTVSWRAGGGRRACAVRGAVGRAPGAGGARVAARLAGQATVVSDDESLWAGQRAASVRQPGAVVRVSGVQTRSRKRAALGRARGREPRGCAASGLSVGSRSLTTPIARLHRSQRCAACWRPRHASCSTHRRSWRRSSTVGADGRGARSRGAPRQGPLRPPGRAAPASSREHLSMTAWTPLARRHRLIDDWRAAASACRPARPTSCGTRRGSPRGAHRA